MTFSVWQQQRSRNSLVTEKVMTLIQRRVLRYPLQRLQETRRSAITQNNSGCSNESQGHHKLRRKAFFHETRRQKLLPAEISSIFWSIVAFCFIPLTGFGLGTHCSKWELFSLTDLATKIGLSLKRSIETKQRITRR